MKENLTNKKKFDDSLDDYKQTYSSQIKDFGSQDELDNCAYKFAYNEVIVQAIKDKTYKIAYGSNAPDDVELFDVLVPYDMTTGQFSYPVVAVAEEDEQLVTQGVKYNGGHIKDDTFYTIKFWL